MSSSSTLAKAARLPRNPRVFIPVLGMALLVAVIALLEGDLPEDFGGIFGFVRFALRHFGVPASLFLLYIEESGIPLPVPGDVYLIYLGRVASGSTPKLLLAWLAVIVVVAAGASNMYWISRRWGRRLIEHRLAAAFHVDPEKVARAEAWFARWGALAVIFGRHVPGMRIPITITSGIFRLPFKVFVPSVAVSTGIWAIFWIELGSRYGSAVGRFIGSNRWSYLVGVAIIFLVLGYIIVRLLRTPAATPADK